MNSILIILLTGFVLIVSIGLVALAWGIAHAPEAHEDESGFQVDGPAAMSLHRNALLMGTRHDDHPQRFGETEPLWHF